MATPAAASNPGFKLIYRASGMTPVRMVQLVAMAFAVGGSAMALQLMQAPAQQSIPHTSKLAWAGILLGTALAAPVVAWLYGRNLVSQLWLSDDGTTLRVVEPGLFGLGSRDLPRRTVHLQSSAAGDPSGEKALAPARLEVQVDGGRNFVVVLDGRGVDQRPAVLAALKGG